jgi:hypothetical protein
MLDALLSLPFLLFGIFAVYCAREVSARYEDAQVVDKIRNSFSPPNPKR